MSGGSFDYLFLNLEPSDLGSRISSIHEMADVLQNLEGGEHAARATRDVIRLLNGASRIAKTLEKVWHDVEWWRSCDYSEETALRTVASFGPYEPGT